MTKAQADKNQSGNTIADKIMQGVALFGVLGLAYWKILDYVPTMGTNMRYVLPMFPLALFIFLIVMPVFRTAK